MRTFQLFIDDDRYSVPTLLILELETEAAARAKAEALLADCGHHLGVEVCENGARLFACGTSLTSA